jgi:soluble lytic murein transglycosylase-like protein
MNDVRQFIIPGAIIGSLILASFGYTVMARVPSSAIQSSISEVDSSPDAADPIQEIDSSILAAQGGENNCAISDGFPEDVRQWCEQIMRHANKNGLDPDLIAALIWQESGGNPTAYSKSGAVGLMQVMPRDGIAASFQCVNGPCFTKRPSISELERPNFNIKYGTGMLAGLFNKYGDMREALKYYGPMNVGYYYADKVLNLYNTYSS